MKFLSDKLLVLLLTVVMGLSPLQGSVASVSKSNCMSMGNTMQQHQMKVSDPISQSKMNQSDMKHDCCNQNECATTHCANASVAAIISNNINNIPLLLSAGYKKPNIILISFPSSSLYRPPRV